MSQEVWVYGGLERWAFVGKINNSNKLWSWQKQIHSLYMNTVTALSVDPAGAKLACYGYWWEFDDYIVNPVSQNGYLLLLDAKNGAIVSKLMRFISED